MSLSTDKPYRRIDWPAETMRDDDGKGGQVTICWPCREEAVRNRRRARQFARSMGVPLPLWLEWRDEAPTIVEATDLQMTSDPVGTVRQFLKKYCCPDFQKC